MRLALLVFEHVLLAVGVVGAIGMFLGFWAGYREWGMLLPLGLLGYLAVNKLRVSR